MTTEQHAWESGRIVRILRTNPRHQASPVCGCGQDLDMATGRNCPRCGTALMRKAA